MKRIGKNIWTCDFAGCSEVAQWYRKHKGELVKLCLKHEEYLAKLHWGRRVEASELSDDDIEYLEEKEEDFAEMKKRVKP